MITSERLREVLHYDPETGVFTWKTKNGHRVIVGREAGCVIHSGHVAIRIDGHLYRAHRLAWFYTYGEWPDQQIDHKNRNPVDNRISNLRLCNNAENSQNSKLSKANSSGVTGITRNKQRGKWQAQITVNRKNLHLGLFETIEEAASARKAAEEKYQPFRYRGEGA